jgi:hypothetical protein
VKILLDEGVPRLLRSELPGHDVYTVTWMGWSGTRNGILLDLAVGSGFDVFVTCDRNLEHQQNISTLGVAVIVLAVRDTRVPTILPLAPDILTVLASNPNPAHSPSSVPGASGTRSHRSNT